MPENQYCKALQLLAPMLLTISNRKTTYMKINLHQHSNNNNQQHHRRNGSYQGDFSFTQAILWFVLAAIALCLLDTAKAQAASIQSGEAATQLNTSYNGSPIQSDNSFSRIFQYSVGTAIFSLLKK